MSCTSLIKPIRSEQDDESTLRQIEGWMKAEYGTPEVEESVILAP